jgi:hypothetical protein
MMEKHIGTNTTVKPQLIDQAVIFVGRNFIEPIINPSDGG